MEGLTGDLQEILQEMAERPLMAAERLEGMAGGLLELASRLRQSAEGTRDPGGMADRVAIRVVGPDGEIKQETTTGD